MPSPFGLLKRVFSRNRDAGDDDAQGRAYLGASWHVEPPAPPRPTGAYPRPAFSPAARGQEAVGLFLRGEPGALARLSAEQERASRLAAEAPRTAGMRETLEWVETRSPQALEQVLEAQRRAEARLRGRRLSLFPRSGTGDHPQLRAPPVDDAAFDASPEELQVESQVGGLRRRNLTHEPREETNTRTDGGSRYIQVSEPSEGDDPAEAADAGGGVLGAGYWQVPSQPGSAWSSSSSSSSGSTDGSDEDTTAGEGGPSRLVDRFPAPPLGSARPLSADGGRGKSTDTKADGQGREGRSTAPGEGGDDPLARLTEFPQLGLLEFDGEDGATPAIPPRSPRRASSPRDLDALGAIVLNTLPPGGEGEQGGVDEDWDADYDDSDESDRFIPVQRVPSPPVSTGPLPPHLQAFLESLASGPPPRPAPAPPTAPTPPGVPAHDDFRPIRLINNFRTPGFKQRYKPRAPASYPFAQADGRARLAELRRVFGLAPDTLPRVLLLGLITSDPGDRVSVSALHPGVAARANQVDWRGVDLTFASSEEQQLYDAWCDGGDDLFPPYEGGDCEDYSGSDSSSDYGDDDNDDDDEDDMERAGRLADRARGREPSPSSGSSSGSGAGGDRGRRALRKPGRNWFPTRSRLSTVALPVPGDEDDGRGREGPGDAGNVAELELEEIYEMYDGEDAEKGLHMASSPCRFPSYY